MTNVARIIETITSRAIVVVTFSSELTDSGAHDWQTRISSGGASSSAGFHR